MGVSVLFEVDRAVARRRLRMSVVRPSLILVVNIGLVSPALRCDAALFR